MKESEAKTKWCPHVASVSVQTSILTSSVVASTLSELHMTEKAEGHKAALEQIIEDDMNSCKGSACAMWESSTTHGEGNCGLKTKSAVGY